MTSVLITTLKRPNVKRLCINRSRNAHFWMRAETKEKEKRTILLPVHTKQLIESGHSVSVEECPQRCVPASEYAKVGCKVVPTGSWVNSKKDTVILGLKELPDNVPTLSHSHVMFAHCYKGQAGAQQFLHKFVKGGGKLYDLEFLVDSTGRRIAAFGTAAGTVGMAVALLVYAWTKSTPRSSPVFPALSTFFNSYNDLAKHVNNKLSPIVNDTMSVMIIGAKGRVGKGSQDFIKLLPPNVQNKIQLKCWDMDETAGKSGPFEEIMDSDIFVNAILLPPSPPPGSISPVFVNEDLMQKWGSKRKLRVIADLSCDVSNPRNPLKLQKYVSTTNFDSPTIEISNTPLLHVIAIDHLPSLVPYESSKEFADALLPYLLHFDSSTKTTQKQVWDKALNLFNQHLQNVKS